MSPWTPPLPVIGLLGGVASGKSLVSWRLQELGCGLLDGDRAGHDVLKLPQILKAARERWGDVIFGVDGQIVRPALARIVFAPTPHGSTELKHLEQLTHPLIEAALQRQADQCSAAGRHAALVLDAPVMLKCGWNAYCQEIWFVDAPSELRLARALARGWTAVEFARREAAQETIEIKRQAADVMIDNSGTQEHTREQVDKHWKSFVARHMLRV